ncbi:hypothetical protein SAMN05444507_1185 [Pseudomonas syringae]|uniref:Uncharacterized protein n=1 Tax=Pseudomonas syringae pv. japonica str. M301072 TaxID=629262 RepID=F3FGL9_PSESX|nr:contact-dependent growth inhibition system immunity protein [Pseudomonas syringae]EGH29355.1 hypothetical protein PSYJA_10401 [Pseudomonas syringae pv. japonica str. M301072]SFJ18172.1 hypothetical protein SAMN05444507_1185 [Pseudomonas syringae]
MNFRDLEKKHSVNWRAEDEPSSLTLWYLSVRDTKLDNLAIADYCRALRQDLFVDEMLPFVVKILELDAFAGDKYDGELIAALANINPGHWMSNLEISRSANFVLQGVELVSKDAELSRDISNLKKILSVIV